MQTLSFVSLSERMYKYTRSFSIKSIEDALVELITNCTDAYNKTGIKKNRKIFINVFDGQKITVTDYACGLNDTEMANCFLQVGNYTNCAGNRGFFSRGAKDISAIGDITFDAIKDGFWSQVFLNRNAYGSVTVPDTEVTNTIRDKINIPDPFNGLTVTILLMENFYNTNPQELSRSLSKLCTLRDIMSDENNEIIFSYYDKQNITFKKQLCYEYLGADLMLSLEYKIPGYENTAATAKFVVYKTEEPIDQPIKESELEFGFLIKDSTTIYECNTIDNRFRWNPYMPYLRGYLVCENISKMLLDYDDNGSSPKNPYPIIDPTRVTGVNNAHPFIQSLFSIPKIRVDQILRELNKSISNKSLSLDDASQLFKDINDYALNIIPTENLPVTFTPNYDEILTKAIQDDRMNYVISEQNLVLNSDYNIKKVETDQYMEERINQFIEDNNLNKADYFFITDQNDNIIAVPYDVVQDDTQLVDQLERLDSDALSNLNRKPYIYKLDDNGKLIKLYMFQKGKVENTTNPDGEYAMMNDKKFNVVFFNDINVTKRYVIDYSDGITIRININDDSVKKYLITGDDLIDFNNTLADNIVDSKSLIFFKELLTAAFADIIVENDTLNDKLNLQDGDNYNNMKKVLDYKNNIITQIQTPLDSIFQKYVDMSVTKKSDTINQILESIAVVVRENIDMNSVTGDRMRTMKGQLLNALDKIIT